MPSDYRTQARKALERAKTELESDKVERLKYAALELRMAFEALIYERAHNYKEEIPEHELSTWQPRRLLGHMLEIDPHADKSLALSIGAEREYGVPAEKMTFLGKERAITLGEIKDYYDRLGSYLHTPTIRQQSKGESTPASKVRERCVEASEILVEVLSTPLFNVNLRSLSQIRCGECGNQIVRRLPPNTEVLIAKCLSCKASYELTVNGDGQIRWSPQTHEVPCHREDCEGKMTLWHREIEIGTRWRCNECGGTNQLDYGIRYEPPSA